MPLVWTRSRDGEHNGKPCYEYHACADDRRFHIVWAGKFGFTASRYRDGKHVEYLTERRNIHWAGTLSRCKAACDRINDAESCPPA